MAQIVSPEGVGPPPEVEVVADYKGSATPRHKVRIDMVLFVSAQNAADLNVALAADDRARAIDILQGVVGQPEGNKGKEAAWKFIAVAIDPDGYDVTEAAGGG